jgi:two-component system, chemotaxis family, sensor kinase Cph1
MQVSKVRRAFWWAAILWTLLVIVFLAWDLWEVQRDLRSRARAEATALFNKDRSIRQWAGEHGGVYVPVDEKTQPNPNMAGVEERDVLTPSGRRLTLINPALLMQQLSEIFRKKHCIIGHLTSMKLIDGKNAPDAWEEEALGCFSRGETVYEEMVDLGGEEYFRLMRPLYIEKGCLRCHSHQGYTVGDVCGGISISLPLRPYLEAARKKAAFLVFRYGTIWLIILAGIWFAGIRFLGRTREADAATVAERRSFQAIATILESMPVGVAVVSGGRVIQVNAAGAGILGRPPEEIEGRESLEVLYCDRPESASGEEDRTATRDGRPITLRAASFSMILEGRSVQVEVFRDVTEKKQDEEALKANMGELERFNRIAVGREERMIELKMEVDNLLRELGRNPRFRIEVGD